MKNLKSLSKQLDLNDFLYICRIGRIFLFCNTQDVGLRKSNKLMNGWFKR